MSSKNFYYHTISGSNYRMTNPQAAIGLAQLGRINEFYKSRKKIFDYYNKKLNKFKSDNKQICGYASTAKSTTVLNYCDIGTDLIDYICDTTTEKIGKFSPGKHIPVVPMSHFKDNIPDIAFLLAWNHKEEIFLKEKEFKKNGGTWFSHVAL